MSTSDFPLLAVVAPGCKTAEYTTQVIYRYAGNPLIEALGPLVEIPEAVKLLIGEHTPVFKPSDACASLNTRLAHLDGLRHFCLPQSQQIELVSHVDRMIRDGYIGRIPNTASHFKIFTEIQKASKLSGVEKLNQASFNDMVAQQRCDALIGHSGAGKTQTVERISKAFGKPIFHPRYGIYQLPCIVVEAEAGGMKSLLTIIIEKIDSMLPHFKYREEYLGRSRKPSVVDLLCIVARLCTIHCIGIIIIEEIQKLEQHNVRDQALLNQILTLANLARVPILFTGTNKATQSLWKDGALARRASGIAPWERLAFMTGRDELTGFIVGLLKFQYLPNAIDYSTKLGEQIYMLTQGIIGVIIDLFIYAQQIAIKEGATQLREAHFTKAYFKHLNPLHGMLDALRSGDYKQMVAYPDYAPVSIEELERSHREAVTGSFTSAQLSPSEEGVIAAVKIATSIHAAGVPVDEAIASAKAIVTESNETTAEEAVVKVLKKRGRPKKEEKVNSYADEPEDYRREYFLAQIQGTTVAVQLERNGKLKPLLEILGD